jgi:hypothetical protein
MRKINLIIFAFIFSMSMMLINCGGGGSSAQAPRYSGDNKDIIAYNFPGSKNTSLGTDVYPVEKTDTTIKLTVPYGTNVTAIVAEFVANSTNIKVNGVIQQSGVTANDFTNPVIYSVYADNNDKRDYTVTVTKAPNTEKKISTYSINNINGTIDEGAGTISVVLLPKTAVNSLKAKFSILGKSITANGGIDQVSEDTANDFTNPVVYTVTADDNSSREYTVTVTVAKATTKNIMTFSFPVDINPSLGIDVNGTITDTDIQLVIPFGKVPADLIAYFTTDGESVKIGSTVQEAGVTSNDFTAVKTYRVTAENADYTDYTVTVSVAKSDAKALTRFFLDGEKGTINESAHTISISFQSTKILTGLTADFVTTGVLVTANTAPQTSGVSANNFTNPVVYTVTADDGTTQPYTVTAVKEAAITGLWNFEYGTDGSYSYSEPAPAQVTGPTGNALQFDGMTEYVATLDSDALTLADGGSIEAVIKPIHPSASAGIVHKGILSDFSDETYSLQYWGVDAGGNGPLKFLVHNTLQDANSFSSVDSTTINVNTWYHIIVTWTPTGLAIYINGNLNGSYSGDVGQVKDSDGPLVIGSQLESPYTGYPDWGNMGFNGIIDKVQMFNHALTAEEVTARYQDLVNTAGSGFFTAYLLSVASRHIHSIYAVLGIIVVLLVVLFLYNRKRTKLASQ